MSLRRLVKSWAPHFVSDAYYARQQLSPLHSSDLSCWIAAFSPKRRSALEQSRFGLLPPSLRRPMESVVDVGANEGQWMSSLLALVPVRQAFVFEPNPSAMQRCKQRLQGRTGLTFHEVALGSRNSSALLHVTQSSDFSSLLQPRHDLIEANYVSNPSRVVAEQQVEVCPLDELIPAGQQIDLLKIDVQGFEREVVAGAAKVIQRTRAVLVETNYESHYGGKDTFASLYQLFTLDLGFRFWDVSNAYHGKTGQALWADAVFINPAFPA